MVIIDTNNLPSFLTRFAKDDSIVIPILADHQKHPLNNTVSALYVEFISTRESYIVPFTHYDAEKVQLPTETDVTAIRFTPNKKLLHNAYPHLKSVVDINLLQYVNTALSWDIQLADTPAHLFVHRRLQKLSNLNTVVPLVKHAEQCAVLSSNLISMVLHYKPNVNTESFKFMNDIASPTFRLIERAGVHVDPSILQRHVDERSMTHVTQNNLMYTEYNLYTTTGRPSNRFGGINFAALNKDSGIRSAFTSRFGKTDGLMVLLDFDAYHLRLIANLIGYEFPEGNVHEHLGKLYFGVTELTQEQYDESKKISFGMLYGGIKPEYQSNPFFKQVDAFVRGLWERFNEEGRIVSVVSGRQMPKSALKDTNPQKLFNYFIQMHETEMNVMMLDRILPILSQTQSKVVLYTYDSILIDYSAEDGLDVIREVKSKMEMNGRFPTKVFAGFTYHDMHNITHRF